MDPYGMSTHPQEGENTLPFLITQQLEFCGTQCSF